MENDALTEQGFEEVSDSNSLAAHMTVADYEAAIESILFAAGHPVTYDHLAKLFELPEWELKQIVFDYADKYNNSGISRGVTLLTLDSCCELCTKAEYLSLIRAALGIRKSSGALSTSTMEALTIIAYKQPVTRAYVDAVRNSDSSYAITNLLDKGLIEPKGRKDAPGRPILYGTTSAFLRSFGINSLTDLPGNDGQAQNIFDTIDKKLNLGENSEQITIDDLLSNPVEEPIAENVAVEETNEDSEVLDQVNNNDDTSFEEDSTDLS